MFSKYVLLSIILSVTCTGQAAKKFHFIKLLGKPYCLDVYSERFIAGERYIVYSCHGRKNQTFHIDDSGRISPFMSPNLYMTHRPKNNTLLLLMFSNELPQTFYVNRNSLLQIKGTNGCIGMSTPIVKKEMIVPTGYELKIVDCTSSQALHWQIYNTNFTASEIHSTTGFCFGLSNGYQNGSAIVTVACDKETPRWDYDYTVGEISLTKHPSMCMGLSNKKLILITCDQAEPFDFVDGIGLYSRKQYMQAMLPDSTALGSFFALSEKKIVTTGTSVVNEPITTVRKVTKH